MFLVWADVDVPLEPGTPVVLSHEKRGFSGSTLTYNAPHGLWQQP